MKNLKIVLTLLTFISLSSFAQEKSGKKSEEKYKVVFEDKKQEEKAKKDGFNSDQVAKKVKESRKDLEKKVGKTEADKMIPVSVSYYLLDRKKLENCDCEQKKISVDRNLEAQILKFKKEITKTYDEGKKGVLSIQWGYNRSFHSDSDITVSTDKGTYTIKDVKGYDRPSPFSIKYLQPSKLSIPQYNAKFIYWFSKESNWGIGGGWDHSKWVFEPTRVDKDKEHEITGNYTGHFWVNGVKKDFEEIKAGKDASFLLLEHTDGHNYAYLEGLYRVSLLNTERFGIDGVIGAGGGLLIPKTRTRIADQENTAAFRDIDNKFKVAGWGIHGDLSFVFKYKLKNGISPFVKTTGRVLYSKIDNALYYKDEGSISQSMFRTLMPSVSVGVEVPLNTITGTSKRKKLKKQLRLVEKMKKLDEKNDEDKLTLQELQDRLDEKEERS